MEPTDPWERFAEVLLGTAALTTPDVVREAGIEPDWARRLWRAVGFPPVEDAKRFFTQSDVNALAAVRALVELQGADAGDVLQLARVIGQSLARVADAQVTAAAERLERVRPEGTSGEDAGTELVNRIGAFAPRLEQFLGYVWRRHLLAALLRRLAQPSASDRVLVIGFADLVDFTAMSQALDARGLAEMVDRFEAIAYEHIPERGGRVVKMIGDEVMFAVDDGAFGADIAVALVEAHGRDEHLPGVRVGLARGPALSWEGDLFGPTVNLASRLVSLARPNTVLVSDELGQSLQDDPRFELRHLTPVKLHGIGRMRPWVLRRSRCE